MSVLDAHAMSASSLTIEITEDLLVADLAKARTVLNRLRESGIRVAIDDFGSGYATLTYLRELPDRRGQTRPSIHRADPARRPRRHHCTIGHRVGQRHSASPPSARALRTGKRPNGSRNTVATPCKETSSAPRCLRPRSPTFRRTRRSWRDSLSAGNHLCTKASHARLIR